MLTTCLWFDTQAAEAANFYVGLFTEAGRLSKIITASRYGESGASEAGQSAGSVMGVLFELDGSRFLGINGGPNFRSSVAVSFVIYCETQDEIDYFWDRLGANGEKGRCGWIDRDQYGISWQIVPAILEKLLSSPDQERVERTMKATLGMEKLDIAELEHAAEGG